MRLFIGSPIFTKDLFTVVGRFRWKVLPQTIGLATHYPSIWDGTRRISEAPHFSGQLTEYADSIVVTWGRIAKIVTGLRAFARNGNNDFVESLELMTMLEGALNLCAEKISAGQMRLGLLIPPGLVVECRGVRIQQVFVALLSNAYDAISTLSEKWILIEANIVGEKLEISITDSGKGIESEISTKIMQPFFTTKGVGKGTGLGLGLGLGLSMTLGIVHSHGGSLWLDQTNANTCFVIELPLKHRV